MLERGLQAASTAAHPLILTGIWQSKAEAA
jgi:hypothetical protein